MESEILQILNYISKIKGYDFSGNRISMIERRLSKRLHATGCNTFAQYLELLHKDKIELNELVQTLTINVTSFFRDPLIWEFLSTNVLPGFIERKLKLNEDTINVWCAGCSTGEEVYTIAIILNDLIMHDKKEMHINVIGTDINDTSLEFAQNGQYQKKHVINIKLRQIEQYFSCKYGVFSIVDDLRNQISFHHFDLLNQSEFCPPNAPKSGFDLVICRNVLIYFNSDHQERIFNKLNECLNTNGLLILGESEIPVERFKSKFTKINSCCKIFHRINDHTGGIQYFSLM